MNVRIQTLVIVSVCQVLLLIAGPLLQPRCGNLHKMRNLKTVLRSFRQLANTVRNKTKTHSAHRTHKVELPISYTSVSPTCHHPLPPLLLLLSRLVVNSWAKVHDTLGAVITGAQQVSHILETDFLIPYGDIFLVPIVQMGMLGLRG